MRKLFLIAFATLLSLRATASSAAATGFDINDASVLFPIDAGRKPVPYIGLEEETILPATVFKDVLARATAMGIAAPQTSAIALASDWNIMSFRYDPCAPEEHGRSNEPCISELRLVAQPRARFSPADSALHLLYKIKAGQPTADDSILLDLLALKQKSEALMGMTTNGKPLGVHPLLSEALLKKNEELPKLFAEFIRKHATSDRLSKVTMMGLRKGAPTDWIFFGGDIEDGIWKQTSIPNVKSVSDSMVELIVSGPNKTFKGMAIDKDLSLADFFKGPETDLGTYIAATDRVIHTLENPAMTDRNTTDCVSCHAATGIRLSGEYGFAFKVESISAPVPRFITGFPAPGVLPNHPLDWNLRAFGYFGLQPTVSMRSVNEGAQAVELINKIMARQSPGPDCSLVEDRVMSCFVQGSTQFGTVTPSEECLALCKSQSRRR